MKKVLFVATVTKHINTFHIPYLKMFKENGYEVHVASRGNEKIEYCDKHFDLPFERFPLKFNNIKAYKELKKIINENDYEIIHSHTPVGGVLARLAARKARKNGTRSIYTAHGFHFYKGAPLLNWLIYYPIEKICARWTDCLITINKEDYEFAKKKLKAKQVEYVPGVGIDIERFNLNQTEEEKTQFKNSLGLNKNDFVLTCVARLDKNKNQGFLIQVMEQVLKKNQDIHLLLVGSDELNGLYQRMVKEKNLEKNIHFLGNRNDIPQILSITDIILSASRREGLPVNILEAFASGIPVVALECRGIGDLMENGKNGYIVEHDSANKLELFIKCVLDLYNEKSLIYNISKNNYSKIKYYSINKIAELLEQIYYKSENSK